MRTYLLSAVALAFIATPWLAVAQSDYVPLVGVPGLSGQDLNTAGYVNALYVLAISIAAFLAFAKLTYAGVKYVLSDVVTDKESAKKDIKWSLVGLLIVIGAVLILNTINPQLTNLNALSNLDPVVSQTRSYNINTGAQQSGNVLYVTDATAAEKTNFIGACLSRGSDYVYRESIVDTALIGTCEVRAITGAGTGQIFSTPTDAEQYKQSCYANGTAYLQSSLPNGQLYGRCVGCAGSQVFDQTTSMCVTRDVTCDDGSDILACADVTFSASGQPSLPRSIPADQTNLVFSCNYPDNTTRTACLNFCSQYGGGTGAGDTCVLPDFRDQNIRF